MNMSQHTVTFWNCGEKPCLKPYFDMESSAQRADHAFFVNNPGRTYLIRDPYPGELRTEPETSVRLVVVRQHSPDAFERRSFSFWDTERQKLGELFNGAHDEIVGRVLWAVWNTQVYEVSVRVIIMAVRAMYAVMRIDPDI